MSHRLTPVQKRILAFMFDCETTVYFETGHKTTTFDVYVIRCQSFVPFFLKHHGYIHKPNGINSIHWELTDKGIAAVASCKKSPSGTHVIGTAGNCAFCKRKVARDLEATA